MSNRIPLNDNLVEAVAGGALGFDPDNKGTYTMHCEFSGNTYYGVSLDHIIEMAKFGATIPNTPEGEQEILSWATAQGYIS